MIYSVTSGSMSQDVVEAKMVLIETLKSTVR